MMNDSSPTDRSLSPETYSQIRTRLQDELTRKPNGVELAIVLQKLSTITTKDKLRHGIAHTANIERQNGEWIVTNLTETNTPTKSSQEYLETKQ